MARRLPCSQKKLRDFWQAHRMTRKSLIPMAAAARMLQVTDQFLFRDCQSGRFRSVRSPDGGLYLYIDEVIEVSLWPNPIDKI